MTDSGEKQSRAATAQASRRLSKLPQWQTGALVTLLLLIPFIPKLWDAVDAMDEGLLLVHSDLIARGLMPCRDFHSAYGPANYYLIAGIYRLAGPSVIAERIVGLCYRALLIAAMFAFGARSGRLTGIACAVLMAAFLAAIREAAAFASLGALALILWSVYLAAAQSPPSHLRGFVAGILAGGAILYRPDVLPVILVIACIAVGTSILTGAPRWTYAGGMTCSIGILILHVVAAGPRAFYANFVLDALFRVPPARRLPVPPVEPELLLPFGLVAGACVLTLIAAVWRAWRSWQDPGSKMLLLASPVLLMSLMYTLSRADLVHILLGGAVCVSFLPVSLGYVVSRNRDFSLSRFDELLAVYLSLTVLVLCGRNAVVTPALNSVSQAFHWGAIRAPQVKNRGRVVPLQTDSGAAQVGELLRNIEGLTTPGQRLIIAPADLQHTIYNDTYLYFLLPELRPGTYYLHMDPGSANHKESRLATDIASADVIVLTHIYDNWHEPNLSAQPGPDAPILALRKNFTLQVKVDAYDIYVRRQGLPPP